MSRIPIAKTPKCLVGGAFIRSEGAGIYRHNDPDGQFIANIPLCTRKDVRNAVEAAAKAGPAWAKRSAYNRGQILYRLAEMLEARREEMTTALGLTCQNRESAAREVAASVDRITHYAGWTDKYESVLGSVNPVSTPHFNVTSLEPMGVVGVLAPEDTPLLALLSMILPVIVSGNTTLALASHSQPYASILLGEMLATSDLPGGVVNLLTGKHSDIVPTFATHAHLRAIFAVAQPAERETLQQGAAENLKRLTLLPAERPFDWFAASAQGVYQIRNFLETKTFWHPMGL